MSFWLEIVVFLVKNGGFLTRDCDFFFLRKRAGGGHGLGVGG
jgi:hypothetical protein